MTNSENRHKLLITGGTGFLGQAFLRYTQSANFKCPIDITIISSGRTKILDSFKAKLIQLDLTDPASAESLKGYSFDTIVHLATSSTIGPLQSDYERYNDILAIDQSVLSISKYVNCKKLIWASSGAVYGEINRIDQTKETQEIVLKSLKLERPYRIGKIQSEFHAQKFCENYGIKLEILRLFAFSGIDLPLESHFAMGNFIYGAIKHRLININGTGLATRSYLDQNDFSKILLNLIESDSPSLRIINIGSHKAYKLIEIAEIISSKYEDLTGKKCEIKVLETINDSKNFYVPDTSFLFKEIGCMESKSITTSVNEMLTWHMGNHA